MTIPVPVCIKTASLSNHYEGTQQRATSGPHGADDTGTSALTCSYEVTSPYGPHRASQPTDLHRRPEASKETSQTERLDANPSQMPVTCTFVRPMS